MNLKNILKVFKMGIKYFFKWIKSNFPQALTKMSKAKNDKVPIKRIDTLLIDLNGIFHGSAQKVFKYGDHKELETLFFKPVQNYKVLQDKVFADICNKIQSIVSMTEPKKKLVLCIDGPAPIAKQRQQRARRFARALESENEKTVFDSNAITPGTKFMDYLGKYIDFFIREKISKDPTWKNLEVIFSNEKVPGEGEHKLLSYFRKIRNENKDDSYCVFGMDADLIMLCLATHHTNFYVLRENSYEPDVDFYFINIQEIKNKLIDMLDWSNKEENKDESFVFDKETSINDFIAMCFSVGNDFLPHIPGIEINENGIEIMIHAYKEASREYGHMTMTTKNDNEAILCLDSFRQFMKNLSKNEQKVFENKLQHQEEYFEDTLIQKSTTNNLFDIKTYRKNYYKTKFQLEEKDQLIKICHSYIEGIQWVLSYYTKGISNWKWFYPYNYAPFSHDIYKSVSTFEFPRHTDTKPTLPFIQLLSVLPPKSSRLIPPPLCGLLDGLLKKYCPSKFEIDISGMRQKWEGIVIIPFIDYEEVEKLYFQYKDYIPENELVRNKLGKSYIYKYSTNNYAFKSYYGELNCFVSTNIIDF